MTLAHWSWPGIGPLSSRDQSDSLSMTSRDAAGRATQLLFIDLTDEPD
jgi:hypothetical protein